MVPDCGWPGGIRGLTRDHMDMQLGGAVAYCGDIELSRTEQIPKHSLRPIELDEKLMLACQGDVHDALGAFNFGDEKEPGIVPLVFQQDITKRQFCDHGLLLKVGMQQKAHCAPKGL